MWPVGPMRSASARVNAPLPEPRSAQVPPGLGMPLRRRLTWSWWSSGLLECLFVLRLVSSQILLQLFRFCFHSSCLTHSPVFGITRLFPLLETTRKVQHVRIAVALEKLTE